MNRLIFFIAALLIGGCSSLPSDLRTAPEQTLLPFSAAATTEPSGQTARWGGEITKVNNLEQGSLLEVVEFSLNSHGRPVKSDTSGGRFKILASGFIDPVIYAPGRMVTALGHFVAIEEGKVGAQAYRFPTIRSEQLYLWPEPKEPSIHRHHYDPFFFHRSFMMRPIILVPAD